MWKIRGAAHSTALHATGAPAPYAVLIYGSHRIASDRIDCIAVIHCVKHVAFEKALEVYLILVALRCCTRAVQYSTVRARAFSGVSLVDAPRRRLRRALLSRVAWLQLHPHHLISSHQIRAKRSAEQRSTSSTSVLQCRETRRLQVSISRFTFAFT